MIISDKLAKKIVDTAMCAVHCNVNIMNRDGIIIATGHPHRYRTFHKGAKDAIDINNVIEIYPNELHLYPGALQGVNLPMVLDDQIVGAVGIFGHPDEVRDTAQLVKMITELILERELLQQELNSKHRLREQFVEIALWHGGKETPTKLKRIAKSLDINLLLPRAIAIFDSSEIILKAFLEYGETELVLERITDIILKDFNDNALLSDQDIAVILDKKLVILKTFPIDVPETTTSDWAKQLIARLTLINDSTISCGLGAIVSSIAEYLVSYRQAEYCLANCTQDHFVRTIYDRDLLVRFIFFEARENSVSLAMHSIAKSFNHLLSEKNEYHQTIQTLLANNLDVNKTANALHIHRNTLIYRLNRCREETGLVPSHCLDDAIMCKMLLELYEKTRNFVPK